MDPEDIYNVFLDKKEKIKDASAHKVLAFDILYLLVLFLSVVIFFVLHITLGTEGRMPPCKAHGNRCTARTSP